MLNRNVLMAASVTKERRIYRGSMRSSVVDVTDSKKQNKEFNDATVSAFIGTSF